MLNHLLFRCPITDRVCRATDHLIFIATCWREFAGTTVYPDHKITNGMKKGVEPREELKKVTSSSLHQKHKTTHTIIGDQI